VRSLRPAAQRLCLRCCPSPAGCIWDMIGSNLERNEKRGSHEPAIYEPKEMCETFWILPRAVDASGLSAQCRAGLFQRTHLSRADLV
jgi:hypothetical protein